MRALVIALLFGIAILFPAAAPLQAQEGPAAPGTPEPPDTFVRVVPAAQTVANGANVSVDVTASGIDDPDGLGAYEFAMSWDPNVLTFVSATNGPFLGSTGRPVSCLTRFDIDGDGVDDPGVVIYGCVTFAFSPAGPTGDGLLASVTFSTSCAGQTALMMSGGSPGEPTGLGDILGNEILHLDEGGAATVEGGTPCIVSATRTPTRTATRTPTRTATPGTGDEGDVDCNDIINAIDALLILQLDARLLTTLACIANADVSDDGTVNAIDALFILQFVAGRLPSL